MCYEVDALYGKGATLKLDKCNLNLKLSRSLSLSLLSGSMSQHWVVLFRARALENRQRVPLRIQNSHRVHVRPGLLQARPRPHPVLGQWSVELEEREAALPE